jgi:hypothetical protein
MRPVPKRIRVVALLLCCTCGCSWITVNRPPTGPVAKDERLDCTTSVAAPVADTVIGSAALVTGGTGVGVGIAALAAPCDATTCWITEPVAITYAAIGAVLLGLAVAEAFSAAYGFSRTAECRDLEQAQLACVSGVEASCARLRQRGPDPAP